MNPLLSSFLSSLFRWVLTGVGAWFVQKGILDETQVTEMIAGAVLALVALAWSLWQKYQSKLELFTVAAMQKGTTLEEARKSIAAGVSASAGTGAGDVPHLVSGTGDGSIKPRLWVLPLLLAGSLVASCATMSPRAQAVQTHQGIQTLLASVDDAERVLCFGSTALPPAPSRCTTDAARAAGLTDARHQAISRALVKAFSGQVVVGMAISVWQPGQPLDMSQVDAAAADIDRELAQMNAGIPALAPLLAKAREWVAEINRLKALFKGGL